MVNYITICIGAIADNGKSAVILSDKFHYDEGSDVQYYDDQPKIRNIFDNCYMGYHKDDSLFEELLNLIKNDNEIKNIELQKVPDKVYDIYMQLRDKKIEESVFRNSSFKGIDDFRKQQKVLAIETIRNFEDEIQNFYFDLTILIIGVNIGGFCLTSIEASEDFVLKPVQHTSFMAIGNGKDLANSSLRFNNYNVKLPLHKALYLVYEAKKRAEFCGSLSKENDIVILRKGEKPIELFSNRQPTINIPNIIKKLEIIYSKKNILGSKVDKQIDSMIAKEINV